MAAKYELFPIIKLCCFAWMWNCFSSNLPHKGLLIKASWPRPLFAKKGGAWGWLRYTSDSMVGLPTGVPASHSDEGRSGYFPSSGLGSAGGHGVTIFGFVGIWSLSQLLSSALIACKQPQMTCKQSAAVFSTALFTKTKTNLACGKKVADLALECSFWYFMGFFSLLCSMLLPILSRPLSSTTSLSSLFLRYRAIPSFPTICRSLEIFSAWIDPIISQHSCNVRGQNSEAFKSRQ